MLQGKTSTQKTSTHNKGGSSPGRGDKGAGKGARAHKAGKKKTLVHMHAFMWLHGPFEVRPADRT